MKILILLILFIFSGGFSSAYSENIKLLNFHIAKTGKGIPQTHPLISQQQNPIEHKRECIGGLGKSYQHGQKHTDGKRICIDGTWNCIGGLGGIYKPGQKHSDGRRFCNGNGIWINI